MRDEQKQRPSQGLTIWITGLSGAGKTTLATALAHKLPGSILLDGDALRKTFAVVQTGFDFESRLKLGLTYGRLAAMLTEQGQTVIVATIAFFHEVHAWNRAHIPNYYEVYLDVAEDIRRRRDPKGLYAREKAGTLKNMAGVDLNVQYPLHPDLTFKDESWSVDAAVSAILDKTAALRLP